MLGKLSSAYEDLMLESSSTLAGVENTLRQLTWFLPGRFEDAEIASEGLYSALSVISLYHDSIISKRVNQLNKLPPSPFPKVDVYSAEQSSRTNSKPNDICGVQELPRLPKPSDHSRYTQHFSSTSSTYSRASKILVFIQYVQLLTEMIVKKRGGQKKRWTVLLWLEAAKSSLRLLILGVTGRPLLSSPLPGREVDPSTLPSKLDTPDTSDPSLSLPNLPSIPSLPPAPLQNHILPLNDLLPPSLRPPAQDLLPRLTTTKEWIGEVMNATEGLVCVLTFILVAKHNRRRTTHPIDDAWSLQGLSRSTVLTTTIPLAYLLVSRLLRRTPDHNETGETCLLAETYSERDRNMLWFFLRGSLWQGWTRPKAMRVLGLMDRVWGLNLIAGLFKDHIALVDDLYYYTSS